MTSKTTHQLFLEQQNAEAIELLESIEAQFGDINQLLPPSFGEGELMEGGGFAGRFDKMRGREEKPFGLPRTKGVFEEEGEGEEEDEGLMTKRQNPSAVYSLDEDVQILEKMLEFDQARSKNDSLRKAKFFERLERKLGRSYSSLSKRIDRLGKLSCYLKFVVYVYYRSFREQSCFKKIVLSAGGKDLTIAGKVENSKQTEAEELLLKQVKETYTGSSEQSFWTVRGLIEHWKEEDPQRTKFPFLANLSEIITDEIGKIRGFRKGFEQSFIERSEPPQRDWRPEERADPEPESAQPQIESTPKKAPGPPRDPTYSEIVNQEKSRTAWCDSEFKTKRKDSLDVDTEFENLLKSSSNSEPSNFSSTNGSLSKSNRIFFFKKAPKPRTYISNRDDEAYKAIIEKAAEYFEKEFGLKSEDVKQEIDDFVFEENIFGLN